MNKDKIKQSVLAIVIGLALAGGISWAQVWTPPACNPPGCNTPEPINVGPADQTKDGSFTVIKATESLNSAGGAFFGGLVLFNGFVGIGVTPDPLIPSPPKLEVAGKTKTTDLQVTRGVQVTNNAASGRVLTSDSSGNASWEDGISKHSFFQDWTRLTQGVDTIVYHNLGTDKVMIYLEGKNNNGEIHQANLGSDNNSGNNTGTKWKNLTSSSVTIRRGNGDGCSQIPNCWKDFRITIWKINQ